MTGWRELEATLDAIALRGEAIRLWWRDDDAGRGDPRLERLLELAERRALPLALAVVPVWLDAPRAGEDRGEPAGDRAAARLRPSQPCAGRRRSPCELGGRALDAIEAELGRGQATLVDAFGAAFLAVLVPPWNRLDPQLIGAA